MFQYEILSQYGCSGTKYSFSRDVQLVGSRDIPVRNIRSVRIFHYKILVRKDTPVRDIRSVGIFQYERFSMHRHYSTKYSVRRDIRVQNNKSVGYSGGTFHISV
jgi:hypothetical protein